MNSETYKYRNVELPPHLKSSLDAYVQTGRPLGSFLQACVDNNLREACGRADETNLPLIPVIVSYLHCECPIFCWGMEGQHDRWVRQRREARQSQQQCEQIGSEQ